MQLIEDLFDVSRVITGNMRLEVQPLNVSTVLEAALDTVRPAATSKRIRLESALDPRAGPIMGDPGRLQQVAWNLLMNAVKFTPNGGRVQLHLQRADSHIEIMVTPEKGSRRTSCRTSSSAFDRSMADRRVGTPGSVSGSPL